MSEPTDNPVWTEPPGAARSCAPLTAFEEALLAVLREVAGHLRDIHADLRALGACTPVAQAVSPGDIPQAEPVAPACPAPTSALPPRREPRSRLVVALAENAETDAWVRSIAQLEEDSSSGAVAEVLARVLVQPPAALPRTFVAEVCRWVEENPVEADRIGLALVSAVSLSGEDGGERPQIELGEGNGRELPGLRLRQGLVAPPVLGVPDGKLARWVKNTWESPVPGVSWLEKWALAQGQEVEPVVLLSLWKWLQGQGPAVRDAGQQVLGELGVQAIPEPESEADPRFERESVYRHRDSGGQQVLRPAIVLRRGGAAHTLSRGVVRTPTKSAPTADVFMQQELAALMTDMGLRSATWCRLDQLCEKDVNADNVKTLLDRWIKRWASATGATAPRTRALAFGSFFQEVLRVGPRPSSFLPAWWKTRQDEFRTAAETYFNEHSLRLELIQSGQPIARVRQDDCWQISLPAQVPGYQPGQVVEVRAPVLRLTGGEQGVLKGTLYFMPY
jgi:hypothetical protein